MTVVRSDSFFKIEDIVALLWFLIDFITHLTIELGFVYVSLTTTALKSNTFMGSVWRQYARADKRWEIRDPTVISLEIITVFIMGPLALYIFYLIFQIKNEKDLIKKNNLIGLRHILQMIICVSELYGGFMTFCPEWIEGNPNLDGSNFILLWVILYYYFIYFILF